MAAVPEREQDPVPRPAFDLTFSFYPPAISLKIADRQLAGYALAGLGLGCGVALVVFYRNRPELVENAVRAALEGPGVQVANIAPGSILVELHCDTRDSFLSFMKCFETEQVKQRLNKEFSRIGYNEKLDVTITNKIEVYKKLDVIRKEVIFHKKRASVVDEELDQLVSRSKRKSKQSTKNFHLFNCDKTCNLDQVKSLLRAVEGEVDFEIKQVEQPFKLGEIATLVDKIIPQMKMDYAVFMVHAKDHDCFKEDCYGKVYKALKQSAGSGEKVLVVIAEDEKYENEEEEEMEVISRSTLKHFKTQFRLEYIDGRKSFVFSWNKKHRPIHEEALQHFFDPSKKGKKFEHQLRQPKENVPAVGRQKYFESATVDTSLKRTAVAPNTPVQPAVEATRTRDNTACNPQDRVDKARQRSKQAEKGGSRETLPSETVLLSTRIRYGDISYETGDATFWNNDRKWRPPDKMAQDLKDEYKSTATANVQFITNDKGAVNTKVTISFVEHVWNKCSIS